MRGPSRPSASFHSNSKAFKKASKGPGPGIHGRRGSAAGPLPGSAADGIGLACQLACRAVVEHLEQRQLLSVTPQPAGPQAIGVNFIGGGNGGVGSSLSASDVAGAVIKTANYNNEAGGSQSNVGLVDSNGVALTPANGYAQPTKLSYTSPGTYDSVNGTPATIQTDGDHKLNTGFIYGDSNVDVPGVPYSHFDLYVYETNDAAGRVETTTLNVQPSTNAALSPSPVYGAAPNPGDASHMGAPAGGWVYTQATDTGGTGTPNADYAAFLGLAPDPAGDGNAAANGVSFKTTAPGNGYLNGFQIVNDPWQGDTITAPTLNAPTAGPSSVLLSWTASPQAFSYTVYRNGTAVATGLKTLTYTDTGLTNGTTYNYTVSADVAFTRDSSGNALATPVNSFTMSNQVSGSPALVAPAAPTNVTTKATNNNTNVTVSWTASNFATSYIVQRATSPGGPYTVISPAGGVTSGTSFVDTGAAPNTLTPGQTYYYQVIATNSAGNSAASPAVAGNLAVTGTGDGWTGEFFAGSNSSTPPFNPDPTVNNENNAVFTHLDPVIDENTTTNPGGVPTGAPAGFNGGSFSAIWEGDVQAQYNEQYTFFPSTDDGVRIYLDETPNDPSPNPANAVIMDDKLTVGRGNTEDPTPVVDASNAPFVFQAGAKYHMWMAYENTGGNWDAHLRWGSNSTPKQLIPATQVYANVPPQVFGTQTSAAPPSGPPAGVPNNQAAQVIWVSEAADTYNIYRSTTPGGEGTTPYKTGVTGTSFTDTGLTNGTTYYYKVAGVTTKGVGPQSAEVSVTPQPTAPAAPTGVTAAAGNPASPSKLGGPVPAVPITVTFPSVPFATSYNILRAPVTNGTAGTFAQIATGVTGTGSTVTYTDNTAALGTGQYQYEVVAVNATGSSPASAPTATISLANGVTEQFYTNTNWGGASDNGDTHITGAVGNPNVTTIQPQINLPTSTPDSTLPPGGTQADNYSTIFTGKVHITTGGDYTFAAATDDDGIVYVDGTLVAAGTWNTPTAGGWVGNNVYSNSVDLNLNPGDYDFQFFQEQGGGGHGFQLYYQGPDTGVGNPMIVPTTALKPLTGAPAAATAVTAETPVLNPSGTNYSVKVDFQDNASNELQYQLQRSTDPTFASNVVNVGAATGLIDNGVPQAGGAPSTPMASITDTAAPAGSTFYYRVVALNFEGSTASTATPAVTTGVAAAQPGVEANYFNNQWWRSTNQSTTAPEVSGVGSQAGTVALSSDEAASLAVIDAHGTDTSSGNINTTGTSADSKFPDPAGTIGPDNFSIVFTGSVNILNASNPADATTNYTFYPTVDDDGYLYVDDQLVAADPGGHGPETPPYPVRNTVGQPGGTVQPVPIALSAGKHNIEFFQSNGGGGWDFHLFYKGPDTAASGTAPVIVPSGNPTDNTVAGLTTQMSPLVTPSDVTATGTSGDATRATITWSNTNTSAVRYVLQRSTTSTFTAATTTSVDVGLGTFSPNATTGARTAGTLSYSDSGLSINTTYYYRVAAQNFDGTSSFSANSPTSTLNTANQIPAVTPVTATETPGNQVTVSFAASPFQSSVTGYQIQRTDVTAGGAPQTLTTVTPVSGQAGYSYTDTSTLTNGHTYTYQVVAQNTSGTGPATSASTTSNPLLYVNATKPANHPTGFTGAGDLTLNNASGSAPFITPGGQLELTDAATGGTANSAYETAPVSINGPFSTTFDFQFVSPVADGFTFVIQNAGLNATGGSGGGLGYTGITGQSIAVAFNMFDTVTQVALGTNGTLGAFQNMTSLGNGTATGGAFHQLTGNNTDVFQATISLDPTNDTTTGAVLHVAVRDTTTGRGYATDFTLPANALSTSALFGASSQDYIGFTGATGGSNATQLINDWVFNQSNNVTTQPTVTAIGITDNPTAATVTTANQRSQVRGLVLTFATPGPTTLSASQLSLSLYPGNDNTGTPTALTGVIGTPVAVAGSNNTQWVVPFVASTANTSASGSLNDGIYKLTLTGVSSSGITSLTFHRLYGDVDGNKTVNPADYARLKTSFGSSVGQTGYNPDLDFDNNGTINPADYAQFKTRFGKTFTYT